MAKIIRINLTLNQMKQINAYQLYLQITHLSDIVYINRENINNNFLIGIKLDYRQSLFQWPLQPNPSSRAWNFWKKTVRSTFKIQNIIHLHLTSLWKNGSFISPKGKWNTHNISHLQKAIASIEYKVTSKFI